MTRSEAATILCHRLSEEVADLAPIGMGRRDETWEFVGQSDADFMIALAEWERTGDEAAKDELKAAYRQVLASWREAIRRYLETEAA